jgi:hypothetical protein
MWLDMRRFRLPVWEDNKPQILRSRRRFAGTFINAAQDELTYLAPGEPQQAARPP